MLSSNREKSPTWLALGLMMFFFLDVGLVEAAKVELDPSNWGHEAGPECLSCHAKASPGLAEQWHASAHADANVNCMDCHGADVSDVDATEHEGQIIAAIVSPQDCGRCHQKEFEEQQGSVHAEAYAIIAERIPALADNLTGPAVRAAGCDQCHGSMVLVKGDGSIDPNTWPNSGIGRINPDGSKGSCSACHGRHRFSKAQAREPSACFRCHSGPDSPDREVYEASKHGMQFAAHRSEMNLDADVWIAGKDYNAAPTCVTCHMGAAGKLPSTHDVGLRNAWTLNAPVSERQNLVLLDDGSKLELPARERPPRRGTEIRKPDGDLAKVKAVIPAKQRRAAMGLVCRECHSKTFTEGFMTQFDNLVELFNTKFAEPARDLMAELYRRELLTPLPFDEPIELIYWELWHDEGARARHGASMASPNHAWWEGMYIVGRNFYGRFLPEVAALAGSDADELIDRYVGDRDEHQWLRHTGVGNPILGFGTVPTTGGDDE